MTLAFAETFLFEFWSHCDICYPWNIYIFDCYWSSSVSFSLFIVCVRSFHPPALCLFLCAFLSVLLQLPWWYDVPHVQTSICGVSDVWCSYISNRSSHCFIHLSGDFALHFWLSCNNLSPHIFSKIRYTVM